MIDLKKKMKKIKNIIRFLKNFLFRYRIKGCIQKDGVYRYYIRTNDGYNIFVGLDTYKQALKDKIWLSKLYK